jgi:hypothetical protein
MKQVLSKLSQTYWEFRLRHNTRYFCVGRNKTGTTSIAKAFKYAGYRVGKQRPAQAMVSDYIKRDFSALIQYCRSAEVFQDFPFSCPETYRYLDEAFPGAKFILSVRDSSEQWYKSLVRFHALRFGKEGRIPTAEDLKSAPSLWTGRPWETNRALYDSPDDDPYNKDILIAHYEAHNQAVRKYFRDRPGNFIEINVARKTDYRRFVEFIGADSADVDFPWENSIESVRSTSTQSKR